MPSSQAAASERRGDKTVTQEPPKLRTTLKTPPKQATNPLQFVKVGPCSLYRSAQEQLQKVQEVKKVKPEVLDDPEDWQSNLDNWKSSRRKRQEHIIERVVEVKKLELEEHDRNRRRSGKTFSEMMEERGQRGTRINLAMYNDEDSNDLSDLGIGTSSGKSSVSGDTHDDAHSVLSDRDSELEKNHSDVDNGGGVGSNHENGNDSSSRKSSLPSTKKPIVVSTKTSPNISNITSSLFAHKSDNLSNGFGHKNGSNHHLHHHQQEYDSATTATASSPEPEDYAYENRSYANRSSASPIKVNESEEKSVVKVDIHKRREIFEKASRENVENKNNNNRLDFGNGKSIKERLSILERRKSESSESSVVEKRHSIDSTSASGVSVRERFSREKQSCEKEVRTRDLLAEELEGVKPLRERLSHLEKLTSEQCFTTLNPSVHLNGDLSAKSIKDRLISLDAGACKETEKRFREQANSRVENSSPSERSSSPDSEYRAPRATFHQSLDSLDADASSGPDTFERVQSLEELDYHQARRYPASSSSAEILNDTDREDSGIHTGDASCSVSQADEPIDEDHAVSDKLQQRVIVEEKTEFRGTIETTMVESLEEKITANGGTVAEQSSRVRGDAVLTETGTAEISPSSSAAAVEEPAVVPPPLAKIDCTEYRRSSLTNAPYHVPSSPRPIVYQSPRVPPRRSPPNTKPSYLPGLKLTSELLASPKDFDSPSEGFSSTADSSSTNTICSLNFSLEPDSKNLQSSGSISPQTSEPKISSPVASPRSPSKIPTPLPRKNVVASPTHSSSSASYSSPLNSPLSPLSPIKQRNPLPKLQPSEIPIPVRTSAPSSPTSPTLSSPILSRQQATTTSAGDLRRRTVVEVCEKVVVPMGQGFQATPFITVERYRDEESGSDESELQQEKKELLLLQDDELQTSAQTMIEIATSSSTTTIVTADDEIDVEEEEEEEKVVAVIPVPEKRKMEPVQLPELHVDAEVDDDNKEEEEEEEEIDEQPVVQEKNIENMQQPQPAVRPTTLALERTNLSSDFLSPLSPLSKTILPLSFSSDEEIVTGLSFPLRPPTSVEPPKEKPPPPPVDLSDEENHPIEPLKRLNSTRRIKKEIRSRRSDFLGIEGFNDDELERELTLTRPPDMAAILAEERRIEQLHRRSYDTDSNYEQDSSHERDSGVELGQAEDWTKQPVSPDMSQHSRQSSEPFGASVTSSEEDEITKKEREIIEVLEREEQWRYENNREINSDIGEKLAHKLRELEEEKMQLERERADQEANNQRRRHQEPTPETLRMNEENLRKQEEIARKEDELRQQELEKQRDEEKLQEERERRRQEDMKIRAADEKSVLSSSEDEYASREVLRVERELLQLEQEELKRQRNNLAYREQKQQQLAEQLQEQWKSLQDVGSQSSPASQPRQQQQHHNGSNSYVNNKSPAAVAPIINYRASMPNLQLNENVIGQRRRPPPPPIPPAKPLRLVEQKQRDVTIRNSRIPSADSLPQQVEQAPALRSSCSSLANGQHQPNQHLAHAQQMSRQTLQALSAVPRPKIVQGDQWVQRRKSDIPRGAHDYNYQHWLIQEAEQRRINEQNQRSPARQIIKQHVTGTSVPYTASPPRNDSKPLPDSIIQTLTQRVQSRVVQEKPLSPRRRLEHSTSQEHIHASHNYQQMQPIKVHQSPNNSSSTTANNNNNNSSNNNNNNNESQEKMLSVSGKKKCSHCGDELGRGAAMIIESLRLFYHMECFKCCVCHTRLGDGLMGTDVRVRNHKLHCQNCYSSDDGVKFSCV